MHALARALLLLVLFLLPAAVGGALAFGYLAGADARAFLRRWRPQNVDGQLLASQERVETYARACLSMVASEASPGVFVSERMDAFVVYSPGPYEYELQACLWHPRDEGRVETFRALRVWSAELGAEVRGDALTDGDKACWAVSQYDA